MEFKKLVAISGMPGLYFIMNTRQDGLIIQSLETKKTQFVASRIHNFSLLENISIYTIMDSEPLYNVMRSVDQIAQTEELPHPKKTPKPELRAFFERVLPKHDQDEVYVSDIQKILRWYKIIKPYDLLQEDREATAAAEKEKAASEEE